MNIKHHFRAQPLNLFIYLIPLLSVAIIHFFFNFNADDAYIYMRYAANLADAGSLVYNLGEPINTLTSPFTALVDTVLYLMFRDISLSHKILSLFLLCLSVMMMSAQFRGNIHARLIILSIVILSPCVLLWTVGGLDTPFILFFSTLLVTLVYRISPQKRELGFGRLSAICFLAGLLFLTRYSSVLFTAPLVLFSFLASRNVKTSLASAFIGAMVPLLWLIFSYYYYGDILPTSFYVKKPTFDIQVIASNAFYILQYFVFINAATFLLLFLFSIGSRKTLRHIFIDQFSRLWWLHSAILLLVLYGLTMAGTTHMMFSFRYFVPYIPALTILIADLFHKYSFDNNRADMGINHFMPTLVCVIVFQIFQAMYTYHHSVNGISLNGEFRCFSLKEHMQGLEGGRQMASIAKKHWESLAISETRPPRIMTFCEGIFPYYYMEAYFLGPLISYRHECKLIEKGADYRLRSGFLEADWLREISSESEIIKIIPLTFCGDDGLGLVLAYDPNPCPHSLSARIDEPCEEIPCE